LSSRHDAGIEGWRGVGLLGEATQIGNDLLGLFSVFLGLILPHRA
jgi:hypothetical protein